MNAFEMAPAIFVPMIFFTFVAVIIVVPLVVRSQDRARVQETIRRYQQSGQEPPAELLAAVGGGSNVITLLNRPQAELRRGLVLIAVAIALVILGLVIDLGDDHHDVIWPLVGAAAFPGLIGLASLIMWRVGLKNPPA